MICHNRMLAEYLHPVQADNGVIDLPVARETNTYPNSGSDRGITGFCRTIFSRCNNSSKPDMQEQLRDCDVYFYSSVHSIPISCG